MMQAANPALLDQSLLDENQAMIDRKQDGNQRLAKLIAQAIKESPLSAREIAAECDVTPQAVSGWKKTGRISKETLELFAKAVEKPMAYFSTLATEQERAPYINIDGAFPANFDRYKRIPAFGRAMGGLPERIWDEDGNYPSGASDVYAEVATADPNAFLVPVEGESMVPRFNPGEYALVEPNTDPEIEDDVLVRLTDGRTMIKRLLSRRGVVRLGSYNNQEIISSPPEEISWMYYVAHPVPARKIKQRG